VSNYPFVYAFSATKKGYSGTMVASKTKPLSVVYGLKDAEGKEFDEEGRIITVEFPDYIIVACYIPNAGQKLDRLDWKVSTFNVLLQSHIATLQTSGKGMIWCGMKTLIKKRRSERCTPSNRPSSPGLQQKICWVTFVLIET
jgi:exonuclease III